MFQLCSESGSASPQQLAKMAIFSLRGAEGTPRAQDEAGKRPPPCTSSRGWLTPTPT